MIYTGNVQSDLANMLSENPLNLNIQHLSVFKPKPLIFLAMRHRKWGLEVTPLCRNEEEKRQQKPAEFCVFDINFAVED